MQCKRAGCTARAKRGRVRCAEHLREASDYMRAYRRAQADHIEPDGYGGANRVHLDPDPTVDETTTEVF